LEKRNQPQGEKEEYVKGRKKGVESELYAWDWGNMKKPQTASLIHCVILNLVLVLCTRNLSLKGSLS
jgi:hypothetical protein